MKRGVWRTGALKESDAHKAVANVALPLQQRLPPQLFPLPGRSALPMVRCLATPFFCDALRLSESPPRLGPLRLQGHQGGALERQLAARCHRRAAAFAFGLFLALRAIRGVAPMKHELAVGCLRGDRRRGKQTEKGAITMSSHQVEGAEAMEARRRRAGSVAGGSNEDPTAMKAQQQ